jgi:Cof subfamily protein (haloacid dehalogenase superfamily)
MFRLVALDIDGTTFDSNHVLRERTIAAIRAVRARGVQVSLATGKLFHSLPEMISTLDLAGPQITCNGAAIVDALSGLYLHHWPMHAAELELSRAAFARFAPDRAIGWYSESAIYTDAPQGELDEILGGYHEPPLIHVPRFDDAVPRPVKLLIADQPERVDRLQRAMAPFLADQVRLVRSGPEFLECMSLGTDKGTALHHLRTSLGIAQAEVLALGDAENDIPLIAAAGLGIAMGNAAVALKDRAHAVTATNDEDGVALALERYILHAAQ